MLAKENIFPLAYVIVVSVLLGMIPYILPSFSFIKNLFIFEKNDYIITIIKIIAFIYIVQLSALVHELSHSVSSGVISKVNIPKKYYIPIFGFGSAMDVYTEYYEEVKNNFVTSISGFISQIIYLLIMALIFFKGSSLAIAITSSGFIVYLFVYLILLKGQPGNDFKNLV